VGSEKYRNCLDAAMNGSTNPDDYLIKYWWCATCGKERHYWYVPPDVDESVCHKCEAPMRFVPEKSACSR
jgi:Pyruvate/2-oxoacid:ferredoxin oxidoreductase delta subunit